ncbi:hypothetical protein TRFO_34420 [Tritrichomonas foetus]|uniref:Uncharacterized protein n=1 Tax=Tritrichomonas foetus TaxID=1144522 RepID=A0A1J4JNT2_9EUKA|nr:hypothetical protein TRFO_34420 [Tritrichomonas foetus]|eukprot:OHS99179.1 hypothetical protein TRFO_34420 [Tritrichomonas foetus]
MEGIDPIFKTFATKTYKDVQFAADNKPIEGGIRHKRYDSMFLNSENFSTASASEHNFYGNSISANQNAPRITGNNNLPNADYYFLKISSVNTDKKSNEKKFDWFIFNKPYLLICSEKNGETVFFHSDSVEVNLGQRSVYTIQSKQNNILQNSNLALNSNNCPNGNNSNNLNQTTTLNLQQVCILNPKSFRFKINSDVKTIKSPKNYVHSFLLSVKAASNRFPVFNKVTAFYYRNLIFNSNFLILFSKLKDIDESFFNSWFSVVSFNFIDVIAGILEKDIECKRLEFVFSDNCFTLKMAELILKQDEEMNSYFNKINKYKGMDFRDRFLKSFEYFPAKIVTRAFLSDVYWTTKKTHQTHKNSVYVLKKLLFKSFFEKVENFRCVLQDLSNEENEQLEENLRNLIYWPENFVRPSFTSNDYKNGHDLLRTSVNHLDLFLEEVKLN